MRTYEPMSELVSRLRNSHDPLLMEAADRIDALEAVISQQENILDEYRTTINCLHQQVSKVLNG